jgi:hypothetical protein
MSDTLIKSICDDSQFPENLKRVSIPPRELALLQTSLLSTMEWMISFDSHVHDDDLEQWKKSMPIVEEFLRKACQSLNVYLENFTTARYEYLRHKKRKHK